MGYLHIYCGEGKGKTTAAVGLAVRSAGSGIKVVFAQFLKGMKSHELKILENLPEVLILRFDYDWGFYCELTDGQKRVLKKEQNNILSEILRIQRAAMLKTGERLLIILDEISGACEVGAVDKNLIIKIIQNNPEGADVVLTGRNPQTEWLTAADYITEMKKLRHPYDAGIPAREGIEW